MLRKFHKNDKTVIFSPYNHSKCRKSISLGEYREAHLATGKRKIKLSLFPHFGKNKNS